MAQAVKPIEPVVELKTEPATGPVEYQVKDQEKYDNFRRLAGKRLQAALDKIGLIGNCSNRSQYEYSPAQVEKIRGALQTEIDFVLNKFADKAKSTGRTFEL